MEASVSQEEKNKELVKILSWILIVISALVLLGSIFLLRGYSAMITMQSITKNFDPPVEINFTLYFIQNAIKLLLCAVVFVSAAYVLVFRNFWRKILFYGLIASVIFLIVSPIIDYYNLPTITINLMPGVEREKMYVSKTSLLIWSYAWSIIFSAFFVYVILKLSREEVKLLFK